MGEIANFREAKASKEGGATKWAPIDCLQALLRDLESGVMAPVDGIYIAMVRKDKKGNAAEVPYYAAGLTGLELRGMLLQHVINRT